MLIGTVESSSNYFRKDSFENEVFVRERDLEIVRFLLEMKFSTTQQLFERFFKETRTGISNNMHWCQRRLSQIESLNYIKSIKSFYGGKRLYLPTPNGYYGFINMMRGKFVPKPFGGMDLNTFQHDLSLVDLRLEFEKKFKVTNWISDRVLRSDPIYKEVFDLDHIPDAIFTTKENKKVALELEISVKGKKKYQEKINSYVRLMRKGESQSPFEKVIYVCIRENVFRYVKRETEIYQDLFEVKSELDFLKTETI